MHMKKLKTKQTELRFSGKFDYADNINLSFLHKFWSLNTNNQLLLNSWLSMLHLQSLVLAAHKTFISGLRTTLTHILTSFQFIGQNKLIISPGFDQRFITVFAFASDNSEQTMQERKLT